MNIQELKNRFEARANANVDIQTFVFDDLSAINIDRNKKYPVCLMKIPQGVTTPFLTGNNEPLWENQTITFYIFKQWTDADKPTVQLEQIYRECEDIGDAYLRDILQLGTNEYSLIADKSVAKARGHLHQSTVDNAIGVSWTLTLRVYNALCQGIKEPTALTAAVISTTQINLAWTDNAIGETNYEIWRSLDNVTFAKIATIAADSVAYSDTGLTANTVYYYKVRAIDVNGCGVFSNVVAECTATVIVIPSGVALNFPNASGQTTVYKDGDDAWQAINDPYPANPIFPVNYALLDYASADPFRTLVDNNIHGNKNIFTDDLGTQIYANFVLQDHITPLDWYNVAPVGTLNFVDSIDFANAATSAGHNNWKVPNVEEWNSIQDYELNNNSLINYAPFNRTETGFGTSTTRPTNTSNMFFASTYGRILDGAKTTGRRILICRNRT